MPKYAIVSYRLFNTILLKILIHFHFWVHMWFLSRVVFLQGNHMLPKMFKVLKGKESLVKWSGGATLIKRCMSQMKKGSMDIWQGQKNLDCLMLRLDSFCIFVNYLVSVRVSQLYMRPFRKMIYFLYVYLIYFHRRWHEFAETCFLS